MLIALSFSEVFPNKILIVTYLLSIYLRDTLECRRPQIYTVKSILIGIFVFLLGNSVLMVGSVVLMVGSVVSIAIKTRIRITSIEWFMHVQWIDNDETWFRCDTFDRRLKVQIWINRFRSMSRFLKKKQFDDNRCCLVSNEFLGSFSFW